MRDNINELPLVEIFYVAALLFVIGVNTLFDSEYMQDMQEVVNENEDLSGISWLFMHYKYMQFYVSLSKSNIFSELNWMFYNKLH